MHRKKGLTIIECLIALLLLTITLVGGMAFYFYSSELLGYATHTRIALSIANASLEELKKDINASLPTSVAIGDLPPEAQPPPTIEDVPGRPYKHVQIQITWHEPSRDGQQNIILDTYM